MLVRLGVDVDEEDAEAQQVEGNGAPDHMGYELVCHQEGEPSQHAYTLPPSSLLPVRMLQDSEDGTCVWLILPAPLPYAGADEDEKERERNHEDSQQGEEDELPVLVARNISRPEQH